MKRHDRVNERRAGALARLRQQLASGEKPTPRGGIIPIDAASLPLTKADKERINREIAVLEKRISLHAAREQFRVS